MEYRDLRDFIEQLERQGDLKRIAQPVSPDLEITEIADRVLRSGGPALLFEHPGDSKNTAFGQPVRYRAARGPGTR